MHGHPLDVQLAGQPRGALQVLVQLLERHLGREPDDVALLVAEVDDAGGPPVAAPAHAAGAGHDHQPVREPAQQLVAPVVLRQLGEVALGDERERLEVGLLLLPLARVEREDLRDDAVRVAGREDVGVLAAAQRLEHRVGRELELGDGGLVVADAVQPPPAPRGAARRGQEGRVAVGRVDDPVGAEGDDGQRRHPRGLPAQVLACSQSARRCSSHDQTHHHHRSGRCRRRRPGVRCLRHRLADRRRRRDRRLQQQPLRFGLRHRRDRMHPGLAALADELGVSRVQAPHGARRAPLREGRRGPSCRDGRGARRRARQVHRGRPEGARRGSTTPATPRSPPRWRRSSASTRPRSRRARGEQARRPASSFLRRARQGHRRHPRRAASRVPRRRP